ncbi:MAG: SPFH domain-containing protein [Burkholderiales bacterium]|nr:SPFH domain-containing protein [Burkholderiales bacterium]
MELSNRLKWDMTNDVDVVWKYPSEEILIGSQLVVGEGQEAVFIKGGELLDTFGPGTHTLNTANVPLLNKLINLPFGDKTPFTAEVWFVNKLTKMDLKWGTKAPIQIMDEALSLPASVRSFGRWGYRVGNVNRLLKKIVGSQSIISSNTVNEYLYGFIIQALTGTIFKKVNSEGVSILSLSGSLDSIGDDVSENIRESMNAIGIDLINFNIESINIPDDELDSIREIYRKTLEAKEFSKTQLSSSYAQMKSFEVMEKAASNESGNAAGLILGAGVGMGAGVPLGHKLGETVSSSVSDDPKSPKNRLKAAKEMLADGLITEEQFNEIRDKIIGEI